jgi:hypothetical protein
MVARTFLLLVGVAIGAVAMHYYDQAQWQAREAELNLTHAQALKHAEQQGAIDVEALKNRVNELEVKSVLDDSMVERYTKETAKLQKQLSQAQTDLEFYEQFVPAGPQGSVSIRSFDVTREGALLSYKVLLSRHAKANDEFKGRLQFKARGQINGKEELIDLVPAQVSEDNQLKIPETSAERKQLLKKSDVASILDLQFGRWQQAKGNLVLPSAFELQEIIVNVLEDNQVRASKTVIFKS